MNILKEHTRSICPECYEEISACVYEEDGRVFMNKNCPYHGKFTFLIEKDAWVYKKLMNKEPRPQKRCFENIMISVTHRCNLNCPICYMPNKDTPDMQLEEIKKVISNFSGEVIRLSGGEPTEREDLRELIRFTRQNNKLPALITNGLKLADRDYVKQLKLAGLKGVHLSINSFDDGAYKGINARRLLKVKLKALNNLRKEKIDVTLGFMLAKGVNEKQLRKIYRLYLKNIRYVYFLTIRTEVFVGRSRPNHEQIYLSELIALLAGIIGVSKEDIVEHSLEYSHYFGQEHAPCHINISLIPLLLRRLELKETGNPLSKKLMILMKLIPAIGIRNTFNIFIRKYTKKPELSIRINIRVWHDKYRIDLDEITRCPSSHYVSETDDIVPLCYGYTMNTHKLFL
jgi:uncharacterized radical SAM superfamily Fe-S cluster-containing enzyme